MDEVLAIDGGHGFGLLSRTGGDGTAAVIVVLLNAGLTHRVGPFRMYVHAARRLASLGVDSFRFDLPRVGDGPAVGSVGVDDTIRAVLDTLERVTGARRFVIGGICSAADDAWRIAQLERRIAGVWLFDGFARRGRWFHVARVRKALGKPVGEWPRMARKLVARGPAAAPGIGAFRDWPSPDAFRQQAENLLGRGVRILAMYTGGVSRYLLDRRQVGDTFGTTREHGGLRVEFWPELDHTLLLPDDRSRVLAALAEWCRAFR